MSKKPKSGDQPAEDKHVRVFDVLVPTKASEGFGSIEQEMVHLDHSEFRGRRVVIRLVDCRVVFHWGKARLRSRSTIHPELLAFTAMAPSTRGLANGVEISSEYLFATEPGAMAELIVERGYRAVTVLIPPAGLREQLARRGRSAEMRIPSGVERWTPAAVGTEPLYELGLRLSRMASKRPELFENRPEVRQAAEREVIETLLATLEPVEVAQPTRHESTVQHYGEIVRRAEEHALEAGMEKLYVSDLCDAANVSERTLQTAFQETVGLSPVGFLKRLRLHGARRDLGRSARSAVTVSSIALDWGFWHFGDFSGAYKECFGETPSSTLRRGGAVAG